MKTATANFITHLSQEVTTLAWCWKVTRKDNQVFGFTTHDRDIVLEGVTYQAQTSVMGSSYASSSGGAVDNMDVTGSIDSVLITHEDIAKGFWDNAQIELYVVNWANISHGKIVISKGHLGNIRSKIGPDTFVAEVRSLMQALQQPIGRTFKRRCDANFADARCGLDELTFTLSGSITVATSKTQFTGSTAPTQPGGKLTWTSGLNNGAISQVKHAAAGVIYLLQPAPFAVQVGDTFTVTAGCDKNRNTCRDVYSNIINFRGFPDIPGTDRLMMYPDAH